MIVHDRSNDAIDRHTLYNATISFPNIPTTLESKKYSQRHLSFLLIPSIIGYSLRKRGANRQRYVTHIT